MIGTQSERERERNGYRNFGEQKGIIIRQTNIYNIYIIHIHTYIHIYDYFIFKIFYN